MWEVDLLQGLGKLLLGQERTTSGLLGVYTVLRRHEEFDTGSFGSLSEGFLLVDESSSDSADHDIDALEGSDNAGLVGVVNLSELSTLSEPFGVGRLNSLLLSEKPQVSSAGQSDGRGRNARLGMEADSQYERRF